MLPIAQVQVTIVRPGKSKRMQDVAANLFTLYFLPQEDREEITQNFILPLVRDPAQQRFACVRLAVRYQLCGGWNLPPCVP